MLFSDSILAAQVMDNDLEETLIRASETFIIKISTVLSNGLCIV